MKRPQELQAIANALGGLPIWGVLPHSAAAKAGVRYGDIVLRVNGFETRTMSEFIIAHESNPDRLDLDLFRDGKLLRVQVWLRARRAEAAALN